MVDRIEEAKRVFDVEIDALIKMRDSLDDKFASIVDSLCACKGKIIITGIGKPGHIANKIAATLSSLGTPSFFLHPAEAMHGDLGMVSEKDIVIAISYSGESDEIISILPNIKMIGAKIIAITGNADSTLAKNSDIVQNLPLFDEACRLGLAPTSSTTVELVYGDAMAIVLSQLNGFDNIDFGKLHPAGTLGKNLILRVSDVMVSGDKNAKINVNSGIKEAIVEMSKKLIGMVNIVDNNDKLIGIITSGDLRRAFERAGDGELLSIRDVMTETPFTVNKDELAVNVLKVMTDKKFGASPVVDGEKLIGTISVHDILKAGIVDTIGFIKDSSE